MPYENWIMHHWQSWQFAFRKICCWSYWIYGSRAVAFLDFDISWRYDFLISGFCQHLLKGPFTGSYCSFLHPGSHKSRFDLCWPIACFLAFSRFELISLKATALFSTRAVTDRDIEPTWLTPGQSQSAVFNQDNRRRSKNNRRRSKDNRRRSEITAATQKRLPH